MTQHPQEAWRGPKMQTLWPIQRDHWPSCLWLPGTGLNWIHPPPQQGSCTHALEDLRRVWHWGKRWYEHEPKTITKKDRVTILWDMPIHTDRTIAGKRPDIVLKNKKDKTCLLIDMIIPHDTNTSVKTTEKLNKYKDLEIEVEGMWGLKTTTVPVFMGALGTIKKDMKN